MIQELIARVFSARNSAHLEHWRTTSYAAHTALGEFYELIPDALDTLVEEYQGNWGIITGISLKERSGDTIALLVDDAAWMAKNSDTICQEIEALENRLQEVISLYLRALYKLNRFK